MNDLESIGQWLPEPAEPFRNRTPRIPLEHFSTPMVPDFVIVGVRIRTQDHQVMVLASTSLTQARLTMEADYWEEVYGRVYSTRYVTSYTTTLEIEMRDYVVITANTYQDALRTLFTKWSPPSYSQDHRTPRLES